MRLSRGRFDVYKIPTVQQYLQLLKIHGIVGWIDLTSNLLSTDKDFARLVDIIKKYGLIHQVIIEADNLDAIEYLIDECSEFAIAYSGNGTQDIIDNVAFTSASEILIGDVNISKIDACGIAKLHENELKAAVWTAQSAQEANAMFNDQADLVFAGGFGPTDL